MNNRYKRLGKNSIIVFIGNAGSRIIGLVMLPFYTHFLSKEEYGTSDLINTYSSILLAIVTCCLADAIFIFPKDKSDLEKREFFTSGLVFVFLSFFLVAILAFVVQYFLGEGFLNSYIWWIWAMTLGHFLTNYTQQFTRSIDKMIVYSVTGVVNVLFIAFFSLILLPSYKLNGYLMALFLANILSSSFAIITSKSYKYIRFRDFNGKSLKKLLKYGVPLIPNSLMWWLVDGLNRPVMVANLGMESIGIYAVANKIPSVLTMLFVIFSNAWTISMLGRI